MREDSLEYLKNWPGEIDHEFLETVTKSRTISAHYRDILSQTETISRGIETDVCTLQGPVKILGNLSASQRKDIDSQAMKLKNWRKGPFDLLGIAIESEWRSDLKWARLEQALGCLDGQFVLDIGCNNGYFMYRMAERGAKEVLGIDPILHVKVQFEFIQLFARLPNLHLELLGMDELRAFRGVFDTIFSMGILYHHPDPLGQLRDLHGALQPGGRVIVETIGLPGEDAVALQRPRRYACMKNIWSVPTLSKLLQWMEDSNFEDVEVLSTYWEGGEEQRSTAWSAPVSYSDFLDPVDPTLTVEGYPAPLRLMVQGWRRD